MRPERKMTLKSIADGFGGDIYRRMKVSDNTYQCGCVWKRAEEVPEAFDFGIRGDILIQCKIHHTHTAAKTRNEDA